MLVRVWDSEPVTLSGLLAQTGDAYQGVWYWDGEAWWFWTVMSGGLGSPDVMVTETGTIVLIPG